LDSGGGGGSSSSTHDKQRQLEHTEKRPPPRPPSEAPAAPSSQTQATVGSRSRRAERPRGSPAEPRARARTGPSHSEGSGKGEEAPARGPCAKAASAGVGAFGPVVGLSVVAAVSVAGLLGGRVWAVACACAWLAALSRLLRRQEARAAGSDGGETAVANVDSKEYKKLVVLRGLLDRDRPKAVKAAVMQSHNLPL